MATLKQILVLLLVTVGCRFQEILPQGRMLCVDRNVQSLQQEIRDLKKGISEWMQEIRDTKRDISELKSRMLYLEKNQVVQKDCLGWYKFGMRKDGIFRISPDGVYSFEVYCDMVNGGWTIIQQRIDGSVSFDRLWKDYKTGFGNVSSDHWIGLDNIHLLTMQPVHISFELVMTLTGNIGSALYHGFFVENEGTNFTMHVSPNGTYNEEMSKYISNAGGFYYSNGMQFTTKDRDNDLCNCNCAQDLVARRGGFWYDNCYEIGGLNNDFSRMDIYDGITRPVSRVKIKVK